MTLKARCKEKPLALVSAVLPFLCFIIYLKGGGEIQKPNSCLLLKYFNL